MTKEQIAEAVLGIINDITPDEDTSNLVYDKPLREQLELDSMDFLDIVMELRKKYGVEVPEGDYGHLATLKSCCDYLAPKMEHL